MSREVEASYAVLADLYTELGTPSVAVLWLNVRKRKIPLTRQAVVDFVRSLGEKQIIQKKQKSVGHSISEDDNRWQMDLLDVSGRGEDEGTQAAGKKLKNIQDRYFLIVVNVFDRFVYSRPLVDKSPQTVLVALKSILSKQPEGHPSIISSDMGTEFGSVVSQYLASKKIAQVFKDPRDKNALGVIDRAIQIIKQKLLTETAVSGRRWSPAVVAKIVKEYNSTPKFQVLHGETPSEMHSKPPPAVTFMMKTDQAQMLDKDEAAQKKRDAKLLADGHFRAPTKTTPGLAFRRGFTPNYEGKVREIGELKMGYVTDRHTGEKFLAKTVLSVPAGSVSVAKESAESTRADERSAKFAEPIFKALERYFRKNVSAELTMSAVPKSIDLDAAVFKKIISDAGSSLNKLLALVPDRFVLRKENKSYYVSKK